MSEAANETRCYKCDKAIIGGETVVGINVSAQAGTVIMSPHCWQCAIASALLDERERAANRAKVAIKDYPERGYTYQRDVSYSDHILNAIRVGGDSQEKKDE